MYYEELEIPSVEDIIAYLFKPWLGMERVGEFYSFEDYRKPTKTNSGRQFDNSMSWRKIDWARVEDKTGQYPIWVSPDGNRIIRRERRDATRFVYGYYMN